MKIPDFSFYGDIVAASKVECAFISYENLKRIPLWEMEAMYEKLHNGGRGQFEGINHIISQKYNFTIRQLNDY